ncbi:MAG: sigma-70 family RNA polymerase sigma factor [Chloroflexi bacterium]|nr:sigma-70 family RNA polymerase sigma factor [Chloroflexota bacterium]
MCLPIVRDRTNDALDEAVLVSRVRAGDGAAFAALVARYERPLVTYSTRLLGDVDAARDVTQEVFLRAYLALPRVRRALHLSAWLHRIAANACLDVLRRQQRLRWLPWEASKHDHLLISGPADAPEPAALDREARLLVRDVLARMTPRHRRALLLHTVDRLSCVEVGAAMRLSPSAVRSLLYRAHQEFRAIHAATVAEQHLVGADRSVGRAATGAGRGGQV